MYTKFNNNITFTRRRKIKFKTSQYKRAKKRPRNIIEKRNVSKIVKEMKKKLHNE